MSFGSVEVLLCLSLLVVVIYYYYLTVIFNFWKSRGIPGPKPVPIFGTMKDVFLSKLSMGSYLRRIHQQYGDEPMVGIYTGTKPVLMLNDLDLIKQILIKDFKSFSDRGMEFHQKHEPLSLHLFALESKRWRQLRPKLSPAYTSGKLREMFYLLRECANGLNSYLEKFDGAVIDIRDVAAKYTTDVIGVCAFGLQMNALEDDDSPFRQMGKRIFSTNFKSFLRFRLKDLSMPLFDVIGGWLVDDELADFFIKLTRETINYRRENNIVRHDFLDQLMDLKEESDKLDDFELTDSLMAAQLFVFFIAGFETSAATISNCLLELAMNHQVRDRLRREIHEQLKETNGEITYEGIRKMEYLDRVIKETLRKYPPVDTIMRKSTTPYTFPGTRVSIPTGIKVWIPIYSLQRNPKYFPNPNAFDPERFTEEAINIRPQMTFLSFGDGPRNCIGARFGTMQSKVGIITILRDFTVDICEKTDKEYKLNPRCFLLTPLNGVFVKIWRASIA
ncbi:probable cytochrome P450 6a14 [Diachasmimorpha longicaudata]|uniref:probable cytochrome P450 6a14 n=1 Tax=Diachasmimorpha longicaudata TaxID=58733 RepID=UPI0030B917E2